MKECESTELLTMAVKTELVATHSFYCFLYEEVQIYRILHLGCKKTLNTGSFLYRRFRSPETPKQWFPRFNSDSTVVSCVKEAMVNKNYANI